MWQCATESGGIEAEVLFKAFGARFQQLCFDADAIDGPNAEDTARVLFLRHVGVQVFQLFHDSAVEELSKRA